MNTIPDQLIYNCQDVQSRTANVYHPRQAEVQLSRCTRTILTKTYPWVGCSAVPRGAPLSRIA